MGILAWFLAKLADFQRLIEYFGIGAIFIWLYFLERGDRISRSEGVTAQHNIALITKYYQASWVFFGVAVLAEYALSEEYLTKLFGTMAFVLVNYIAIIFGLVMFAVPSYVVYRKISANTSYALVLVPKLAQVLNAALLALIHTALLWGLVTSPGLTTTGRILAATFLLSYVGIGATFTKWANIKGSKSRLILAMTFLPWFAVLSLVVLEMLLALFGQTLPYAMF
jgi:hypothetical protein